jgi:hypothetical protein
MAHLHTLGDTHIIWQRIWRRIGSHDIFHNL